MINKEQINASSNEDDIIEVQVIVDIGKNIAVDSSLKSINTVKWQVTMSITNYNLLDSF